MCNVNHRTVTSALVAAPLFFQSSPAVADVGVSTLEAVEPVIQRGGLTPLDWALIGAYACATLVLGWHIGRKQRSTSEYFIGSGNMNPLLIGVSLFATLLSTISYLSVPGEVAGKGPMELASLLAMPLVYVIVAYGLLPMYMRQRVTSAYELLEERLGLSIRLLGASLFAILRLFWMSLLLHVAAKAMIVMLGIGREWIWLVVLVMGSIAVLYTSIGGLRAVVLTDVFQSVLMMCGALLVIVLVTFDYGGFDWFPRQWQPTWDVQPIFSFDPQTRITLVGSMLMWTTWYVCTAGGDQVSVQRFMATRDVAAARRAFAIQLVVGAGVTLLLGIVGLALLGYFTLHPEGLAPGMNIQASADHLFPHYVAYHLPAGVSGLIVSAMFAAAMSSVDSGINSVTAVVTTDFLKRFGRLPTSARGNMIVARLLALSIGVAMVLGGMVVGAVPGNIMAVTNKTVNLLVAPIFGLFVFALFVPFARPAGVWAGTIGGALTAALIAFSGPIVAFLDTQFGIPVETFGVQWQTATDSLSDKQYMTVPDPISFQWIGPAALIVDLAIGLLVSWLLSIRRRAYLPGRQPELQD